MPKTSAPRPHASSPLAWIPPAILLALPIAAGAQAPSTQVRLVADRPVQPPPSATKIIGSTPRATPEPPPPVISSPLTVLSRSIALDRAPCQAWRVDYRIKNDSDAPIVPNTKGISSVCIAP